VGAQRWRSATTERAVRHGGEGAFVLWVANMPNMSSEVRFTEYADKTY
jgi:hypothetical protein